MMKSTSLLAVVLCIFATLVAAWTKEDHEIFRIHDEVAAAHGPNVTFYDLLGIKPSASHDEIVKANRKKSRELHPDKARQRFVASYALKKDKNKKKPGVTVNRKPTKKEIDAFMKDANVEYQRLSVIVDILKGPSRERYDHFLRNGFPKWKGTGYYYARFRPGLGSVLAGLLVVCGGGMHYFALVMGWKRRREFVERYIRHARRTAWGDETGIQGLPGISSNGGTPEPQQDWGTGNGEPDMAPVNRRQKRMAEKEARKDKKAAGAKKARSSGISTPVEAAITSGPEGAKKRIVAENGKVLVVDSSGNVFLEEETDEGQKQEFLLDPEEEPKPTIKDTLLFQLPKFIYRKSLGRVLGGSAASAPELEPEDVPAEEAAIRSAIAPNANGEARKRRSKAKNIR